MSAFRMAVAAAALAAAGCGDDRPADPIDAAADPDGYPFVDAPPLGDGGVLGWVDFATGGCDLVAVEPDGGPPAHECRGVAPLEVAFAPVAPGPLDQLLWTFGDGATSSARAPTHVYRRPGRFDVTLAASGPGGSASVTRAGFVVVAPAPLGGACDAAAACGDGRACLCEGACDGAWAAGACAAPCDDAPCAEGACARLGGDAPWSGAWCLPACADGCAAGQACATVPGGAGEPAWIAVCAPAGALAPLAGSCAGADGFDDARCASGRCAPLGVRGLCSAPCATTADCPAGSACATFTDPQLGAWCVAACGPEVACDDPGLACAAPGGAGPRGFTLDGAGGVWCAPAP